jgi:hypothetical protein|tara:strand:- start:334 stop:852 length:519 start_codon:yes stop_codon:yes gene_type:complete
MNDQDQPATQDTPEETPLEQSILEVDSIPENTIVFPQTQWAWLLPSSVWIVLLAAVIVYDFISMGFIPLMMAVAIVVPRYLRWQQTKYYLSEKALYMTMVGLPIIQKRRIFELSFDNIVEMNLKHGTFGRQLGYSEVQIVFKDKRVTKLSYISNYEALISHIESRTDLPGIS